jgi:hypothetical protein
MGLGSQASTVDLMSELTGLTHDIFVGKVQNNVRRESASAMLFQDAGSGDYKMSGQNMVIAVDLRFKTGSMGTDGKLPDHTGMDPVNAKLTPVRRYARLAMDNFVEARATGEGSFADFSDRIFDLLWDSWKSMEIRHSVGAASGLLCKCESRTSGTRFVVKDAFGNANSNPLAHISEGSILCWYDVGGSAIDGAATVVAIDYDAREIEIDSEATWEPGDHIAADDLIYFGTTPDISKDYFTSERNLAPNGLGTIVDPNADLSTVFNIAEADYPRWKPFRKASTTFDHMELTEHWLQLAAKRGFPVTPATDVCVTFPSCVTQVARSLMGFQQQTYTGESLKGGYSTVTVGGKALVEDHFFYHNVAMTLNKDSLFRVNLGGEADFSAQDGSMWSRIADFDGKEAFVADYLNTFCNNRGANSALTGITTDVTDADFEPVPNY